MTFTIKNLDRSYSEQALLLVSKAFSEDSPLHHAMHIAQREYYDYLAENWVSYAFDGPVKSIGAFSDSNEELVGCLIACRFPASYDNIDTLPDKHRPIAALLQALENQFLQDTAWSGVGLLVDLAVVKNDYRGQGIYQQLRNTLHQRAVAAGYNTVFGELSSATAQHVCINKMGHTVAAEIKYNAFDYCGKKPFASIEEPHSIQLVSVSV